MKFDKKKVQEMGRFYPAGAPCLLVKFKPNKIDALRDIFLQYNNNGLDFEHETLVQAIIVSEEWGPKENMIVCFSVTDKRIWEFACFQCNIIDGVESIRFSGEHPLDVLITGRKIIQEQESLMLINKYIGDVDQEQDFIDAGLILKGKLLETYGMPRLVFELKGVSDDFHKTIVIDIWSRQVVIDYGNPHAFTGPEHFKNIARNLAEDRMEALTAKETQ